MKIKYLSLVSGVLFGLFSANSFATENGSDSFALGAEGVLAGALPPPGVYLLSYYQNYTASDFVGSDGNTLIPDFDIDAKAFVPRLVWMTEQKMLGGQLGFYAAQPLVDLRLHIAGQQDHNSGLGDLIFAPMLGWHSGNHHWAAAVETIFPTGDYDKNQLANIGKNYYTFRPILAYSYSEPTGWDISTKMSYSFNTENDDTNYQSGDYLAADYSIGYKLNPNLLLALEGYAFKQLKSDEVNNVDIDFKGQALAYGPGIHYQKDGWSLEAKYLKETEVENRPKGDATWLKFVWSF
jgi:hypothetical protein